MGQATGLDPIEWLQETTEPGDLVLTGSREVLSRLIQRGTRSRVSHTALVRSSTSVIEAYDYGLTPPEHDEGVFETTFEQLIGRSPKLDRLLVRRPQGWTTEHGTHLDRAMDHALAHSPPFPTVGAGLTCLLVILTHPGLRRVTDGAGPRFGARFDGGLDWLVRTVGDGPERVHCSEIATRLYTQVGLELRFPEPTLGPLVFRVAAGKRSRSGRLKVDRRHRDRFSALPTRHRRAEPSERPQVDKGAGSKMAATTRWDATGRVLVASAMTAGQRMRSDGAATADVADLILPSDFERAEPFTTVGLLESDGARWAEVG